MRREGVVTFRAPHTCRSCIQCRSACQNVPARGAISVGPIPPLLTSSHHKLGPSPSGSARLVATSSNYFV